MVKAIYGKFEELGYMVQHRILFAGHYGVPQLRFRTFFIAVRGTAIKNAIKFPAPEYYSSAVANFTGAKDLCYNLTPQEGVMLKKKTTVWDAIGDLPQLRGGETAEYDYAQPAGTAFQIYAREGSRKITSHFCSRLSQVNLERLKHIPQGGSWRDIPFELLPNGLKRARRSDHTKRYGRLNPDELCSTILTKCDPHWGSFFHPTQARTLSVREAARIQSFPDRYRFTGSMTQQYEQVGNAVPPLMGRAIGRALMETLEICFP